MIRIRHELQQLAETIEWHLPSMGNPQIPGATAGQTPEFRRFALQPIVGSKKQRFGSTALECGEARDSFTSDPNIAPLIMLDNWLLYGFEELTGGRPVFLKCTRETLLSGNLALLPHSAVFEISESVKPDEAVLSACQSLKSAGYRIALDNFESLENMEEFLDLADFIKVDFHHSVHKGRACMLRDLKLTRATLIADRIKSEGEFHQAVNEGFGLFQGNWIGRADTYEGMADALDPMKCTCILGALEEAVFAKDEVAKLVQMESGIERRLLRRANWASPPSAVIDSTRDALEVVGKEDLLKIVTLATLSPSEDAMRFRTSSQKQTAMDDWGTDAPVRWMEMRSQTA